MTAQHNELSPFVEVKPGLYYRDSKVDYNRIRARNFSTLKFFDKSPKHYKHALDNPRKETRQMGCGILNHIAVLEPERFATHYVQWESIWQKHHGKYDPDTGKIQVGKVHKYLGGKRNMTGSVYDQFVADNPGKTVIPDKDFEKALGFRDAVRQSPEVMPLLSVGQPEVAIVWRDDETGILLKGRLDWLGQIMGGAHELNGRKCSTDLKGAADVGERFPRQAAKLQMHVQQSMYHDGLLQITGDRHVMAIAAVEMNQPHDAVPYYFTDTELAAGRAVYKGWLYKLAECMEANKWPGQGADGLRPLQLPSYVYEDPDEDLELTSGGEQLSV